MVSGVPPADNIYAGDVYELAVDTPDIFWHAIVINGESSHNAIAPIGNGYVGAIVRI